MENNKSEHNDSNDDNADNKSEHEIIINDNKSEHEINNADNKSEHEINNADNKSEHITDSSNTINTSSENSYFTDVSSGSPEDNYYVDDIEANAFVNTTSNSIKRSQPSVAKLTAFTYDTPLIQREPQVKNNSLAYSESVYSESDRINSTESTPIKQRKVNYGSTSLPHQPQQVPYSQEPRQTPYSQIPYSQTPYPQYSRYTRANNNYGRRVSQSQYDNPRNPTYPPVINNWSDKNENVVKQWKIASVKSSFIYDTLLEHNKNRSENLSIVALCISALSSLFSVSQFGITNENSIVAIVFKILLVVCTIIVTIIQGIIRIKGYDKVAEELTGYIQKMDNFIGKVSSQLLLPTSIREDAVEFIKKENKDYTDLMTNAPSISPSDLKNANQRYVEFVGDNTNNIKQLQKYYTCQNTMDSEFYPDFFV